MRFLLILLVAFATVGCYGLSFNPKATMCIEPGFSDEQSESIIDAAREWHDKTSGEVDLQVRSGNGCEVELKPVSHLRYDNDEVALGITDSRFDWIKFNVEDSFHGRNITHYSLRETALHEIGHYLTGGQHSPHREDIMYAKGRLHIADDGTVGEDRHLTDNDVARWGTGNHSYYQEADHYPAE